jgi:hypothetical protein
MADRDDVVAGPFAQTFDLKKGPPPLPEDMVPAYRQLIDYMCKSETQRNAALNALAARDQQALEAILGRRDEASQPKTRMSENASG